MQLDTAVKLVDITGRGTKVELSTTKGAIAGRYCIITASTNVVLDRIKFDGGLPKRHQDALEKLKLGSFDHIALELTGNPLGLQRDDLVFEKSSGPRTGALLANVGGTPLSVVSVGGKFGRDLAEQGDKAMVEFAVEWLSGHVRHRREEGGGANADDAMEQGAMDAGRDRDGGARLAGRAPHPDGADPQPRVLRRRGGARDRLGHRRRRLGVRHPRGRCGGPPAPGSARARSRPSGDAAGRSRRARARRS